MMRDSDESAAADTSSTPSSSETVIAGQLRALELALGGAPLPTVLEELVRTIEAQSSQGVLGSILLVSDDGQRLLDGAAPSLPAAYRAAIDGIAIGPGVGSCGTAAATGEVVVVSDVQSHPYWAPFKELAAEHDLRACWSAPIRSSSGATLGTFALYHRTVATPTPRDQQIVGLLAGTAALIIERGLEVRRRALVEAELRHAMEEQLRRLAGMFEHAPAAIAVLRGSDHVFEVANPAYLELVGGRAVIGQPIREALPELEGQGFFELLDEVRRSGVPFIGRGQRAVLTRDGNPHEGYFDFVYEPLPAANGATESILVVAFEVTELVQAKLRAEASEHGLKTFIDNLPELAWTAGPDGYIDYYNRRWYEYTGTTFEEMEGWGWERVHDPALLPKVIERWRHSIHTGQPFEMEFTLRGADGISRWFLTRVSPTRDASGKIVRWFGTNTNIDEIKSSIALSEAMAEQSRATEAALLSMREAKERAEARAVALERELEAAQRR